MKRVDWFKEYDNPYLDYFLAGVYKSASIVSGVRSVINTNQGNSKFSDSPLKLRGTNLVCKCQRVYGSEINSGEFLSYFAGRLFGSTLIPLDIGITLFNVYRDSIPRDSF